MRNRKFVLILFRILKTLSVKLPYTRNYTNDKIAGLLNSLEGASEESLESLTKCELKLIIMGAKDREISSRNSDKTGIDSIQANLVSLSEGMARFTKKVEENLAVMVDSCSTFKTYAEATSEKFDTSSQLRCVLKEEELNRINGS